MFERLFSSIGIGCTKVNTVLFDPIIERGQIVQGEVHIFGGNVEQKISEIYVHIDSEFHKFDDVMTEFPDITEPIVKIKITNPFVIKPHEEKIIPISFTVPYYTPITFKEQTVHIQTELTIDYFNHPIETHDFILKDSLVENILSFLNANGFKHSQESGLCRYRIPTEENPTHCLQSFHLKKDDGTHVYFAGNEKNINLFIQNDNHVSHYEIKRGERETDILSQFYKDLSNKSLL